MHDARTTVAELRDVVERFVSERNWHQFHSPKNLAMSLSIEAAEVMEHFQWLTTEEASALVENDATRSEVADEMADVLAYLLSLSAVMRVDLAAALEDKMRRNAIKYPPPN